MPATLLFAVAAHEPIYDVADIHNALGGPLLIGGVLAFARGSVFLPPLLTVALATVDEMALLVLPLVTLYAVVTDARPLQSTLPVAAVTALTSASGWSEVASGLSQTDVGR